MGAVEAPGNVKTTHALGLETSSRPCLVIKALVLGALCHFLPARRVPSPLAMLATCSSSNRSTFSCSLRVPGSHRQPRLTFLDVRGLAALDFLPPFLPDAAFLPLFSGGGERMVSDLPLVPRFLASSSG